MIGAAVAQEAARHIKGTTIAWSGSSVLDLATPNPEVVSIEDYAYALAYSPRWRGQTFWRGSRCFFSVAQHVVRGAEEMLRDGHSRRSAFDFLGHESDEVPFGDFPGPGKTMWSPAFRERVQAWGTALDQRFGFGGTAKELIKRYDIRMLVTEKRDLLPGHAGVTISTDGTHMADDAYAPFDRPIIPDADPNRAAIRFLSLYHQLKEST